MFIFKVLCISVFLIKFYRIVNSVFMENNMNVGTSDFYHKIFKNVDFDANSVSSNKKLCLNCYEKYATNNDIFKKFNKTAIKRSAKSTYSGKTKFKNQILPHHLKENKTKFKQRNQTDNPSINVAVFVDEIDNIAIHLKDNVIQKMATNYMKRVQEIFHHPSLGTKIDIIIARIEVIESRQSFKHGNDVNGNADYILDSFCDYQNEDVTEKSWDLGIYLTNIDLYRVESNDEKIDIIGLANVDSICSDSACAIVELGGADDDDIFDMIRPSFVSTFTTAHEIGHM